MQSISPCLKRPIFQRLFLISALVGCDQITQSDTTTEDQTPYYLSQCPVTHQITAPIHHLLITEIGEPHPGYQDWIEIYNASSEPLLLSEYNLRTQYQNQNGETTHHLSTFALPNKWLQPKTYYVIFANHSSDKNHWSTDLTNDYLTKIQQSNTMRTLSLQTTGGSVELLHNGKTIDFVRYGTNIETPTSSSHWQGGAAPAMGNPLRFSSLMRKYPYEDTQSALDWVVSTFATKGGVNDIDPYDLACVDHDNDGIPDCAETECRTFAGLPYYAWGARPNVQDIFLQLSWMEHPSHLGIKPSLQTLQLIENTFTQYNKTHLKTPIKLHVDTQKTHSPHSFIDKRNFNLYTHDRKDDYNQPGVPYKPYANLIPYSNQGTNTANIFAYSEQYMDIRRHAVFYYALLSHQISQSNKGVIGSAYVGNYKVFLVAISAHSASLTFANKTEQQNYLSNLQAKAILHELGHTLNLQHGGYENVHGKPNYLSSMNYLYVYGLPNIEDTPNHRYAKSRCQKNIELRDMNHSIIGNPEDFLIGFSNGTSLPLNENNLNERLGVGREGAAPIDFNCNSQNDMDIVFDINAQFPDFTLQEKDTLHDFNDWNMIRNSINLTFKKKNQALHIHNFTDFPLPHSPNHPIQCPIHPHF